MAGRQVELVASLTRLGFFECSKCGATEEEVRHTARLVAGDWAKGGPGVRVFTEDENDG